MHASADTPPSSATHATDFLSRLMRVPLPLLLLALQLPLILNPGYFSHDELQWWARADVPTWSDLPWVPWLDLSPLQYRPLTFNLWLVLAHAFAATPWLMHLVFVALGTFNAWLLARVLAGARVPTSVCRATAIVFALSPSVVYVHGWTGTLADVLTLGFALIAARIIQHAKAGDDILTTTARSLGAAAMIVLALLCKESAIVLPALLAFSAFRQPALRTPTFGIAFAGAAVLAYLALRLPILATSGSANPAYAWSLGNLPPRLVEYLLYPFVPPLFEISSLLNAGIARLAVVAVCPASLLWALARRTWRWPAAWLAGFMVALAPVLVLPVAYNHYAYLASALTVAIAAAAWPSLAPRPRAVLAILAATVVVHGGVVMWRMVDAGIVERNLHADLLEIVQREPDAPIVVAAVDRRDNWLVQRLLHQVGRYRGVSLRTVRDGVDTSEPAVGTLKLRMDRRGHLSAEPGS